MGSAVMSGQHSRRVRSKPHSTRSRSDPSRIRAMSASIRRSSRFTASLVELRWKWAISRPPALRIQPIGGESSCLIKRASSGICLCISEDSSPEGFEDAESVSVSRAARTSLKTCRIWGTDSRCIARMSTRTCTPSGFDLIHAAARSLAEGELEFSDSSSQSGGEAGLFILTIEPSPTIECFASALHNRRDRRNYIRRVECTRVTNLTMLAVARENEDSARRT